MKAISIVQDNYQQFFCIIDPTLCMNQANYIPRSCLVQCKYCRSLVLPIIKNGKSECLICKCFSDIPAGYTQKPLPSSSNYIITEKTNPKISNGLGTLSKTVNGDDLKQMKATLQHQLNNKLRLLIIYQSKLGEQYISGMQCLMDILPQYFNLQICLIVYDSHVKLVQLQQDGRVIVVNEDSFQLINDKFYPVGEESMKQLFTVLSTVGSKKIVTMNGTKMIGEIIKHLSRSPTVILWLGSLREKMQFYHYPISPFIDIYPIIAIQYLVTSQSQMDALSDLNKHSTKTKYILKYDTQKIITQKVHYGIYEIFENNTISNYKVEASGQKKYHPQIITKKNRIINNLNNSVILRFGKMVEQQQNIQIRIYFTSIKSDKDLHNQKDQQINNQQKQEDTLLQSSQKYNFDMLTQSSRNKILVINYRLVKKQIKQPQQLYKYIKLFKLAKINPNHIQIQQIQHKQNIDIDLCQFFRQCDYFQKQQVFNNIHNPNCIYAVWPWVGIEYKGKFKKMVFMYYFTGYYINLKQQKIKQIKSDKQIENKIQLIKQKIQELNELCQVIYAQRNINLPNYYENIQQQICPPQHLVDSDEEDNLEGRFFQYKIM